jgi:hypothetical protein
LAHGELSRSLLWPAVLVSIGVAAVMLLAGLFVLWVAGSPRAAPGGNRS